MEQLPKETIERLTDEEKNILNAFNAGMQSEALRSLSEIEKLKEENQNYMKLIMEAAQQLVKSESQNKELMGALKDFHNKIMVQWEKDFGSIHSEQQMDAYIVSGFMLNILKSLPNKEA